VSENPLDVVMAYTLFAVGRSGDTDVVLDYTSSTDWLELRMRVPGAESWNRGELGHGSLYMPELRRALGLTDDSRPGEPAAGTPFALPFPAVVGDAVRGTATYTVTDGGERIDLTLERPLLTHEAPVRA
jgi:hypothetical protein